MKRNLAALLAFAIAAFLPFQVRAQAPALKIAYLDIQKVMLESEKGKEAKKSLTDEYEKRKKEITQRQDEVQKLKDAIEKQTATITPEARAAKEKDYQNKVKDYQRVQTDYQTELQQKDQEMTQKILKDLEGIVRGIGETEKYTLILEKNQPVILYASPSIDITDKVIAQYNQMAKKAPTPAPAQKK